MLITERGPWNQSWPNFVSFVGEVDEHTYTLQAGIFDDMPGQSKLYSFMRLSMYTNNATGRAPGTGHHSFHVFVIFPISVNPYKSFWNSIITQPNSKSPFTSRGLMFITGSIVGILSPTVVLQDIQPDEQILVIVPHSHLALSSENGPYGQRDPNSQPIITPTSISKISGRQSRFKAPVPLADDDPFSEASPSKKVKSIQDVSNSSSTLPTNTTITTPDQDIDGMYTTDDFYYIVYSEVLECTMLIIT
jgi:hypothetical protein